MRFVRCVVQFNPASNLASFPSTNLVPLLAQILLFSVSLFVISFPTSEVGKAMKKSGLVSILVVAMLLAFGVVAKAQQPGKIPRIGLLYASASINAVRIEAFRQGMRELGYVEGKNFVLEERYAEGKLDRFPALAAELVRLKVDVIVVGGPAATRPAKEATTTIPIVMAQDSDPVGNGFIASLARPGGNITGLATLSPELSGKRLELLKEVVPKLSRVAVLGTSTEPANAQSLNETELAAGALNLRLQYLDILGPKDFDAAFQAAKKGRAQAVLLLVMSPVVASHPSRVADLAVKYRLPAIYSQNRHMDAGALMAYGLHIPDLDRRAATYVDKILKGAKPGDLPVEQPKKFEFIINLKAAKQIGLMIPPNVLVRADKVIK
jgi:putative ABC transport system substrate-binding protein